jgi:hypothetical protein
MTIDQSINDFPCEITQEISVHHESDQTISEISSDARIQQILSKLFKNTEFCDEWNKANQGLSQSVKIQLVPHDKCEGLRINRAKIQQINFNGELFRFIKMNSSLVSNPQNLDKATLVICFETVNLSNLSTVELLNQKVIKKEIDQINYIQAVQKLEFDVLGKAIQIACSVQSSIREIVNFDESTKFSDYINSEKAREHEGPIQRRFQELINKTSVVNIKNLIYKNRFSHYPVPNLYKTL